MPVTRVRAASRDDARSRCAPGRIDRRWSRCVERPEARFERDLRWRAAQPPVSSPDERKIRRPRSISQPPPARLPHFSTRESRISAVSGLASARRDVR